jgi:predicted DsbA family dithiol-disulfide isomerase
VQQAYSKDVSVHLRHFPLPMHADAEGAARAVQAAKRQKKEWPVAEKLFENMRALKPADIEGYVGGLGLDVTKFKADFESAEVKKEVQDDTAAGKAAGVRGTPSIYVNGRRFQGQRTLDGFKPVIDEEIKKADKLIQAGTPIDKVYEKLSRGEG